MNNTNWQVFHEVFYDQEKGIWECHNCDRKVQVSPEYKVLSEGDKSATHMGGNGGLMIGPFQITQKDDD